MNVINGDKVENLVGPDGLVVRDGDEVGFLVVRDGDELVEINGVENEMLVVDDDVVNVELFVIDDSTTEADVCFSDVLGGDAVEVDELLDDNGDENETVDDAMGETEVL